MASRQDSSESDSLGWVSVTKRRSVVQSRRRDSTDSRTLSPRVTARTFEQ